LNEPSIQQPCSHCHCPLQAACFPAVAPPHVPPLVCCDYLHCKQPAFPRLLPLVRPTWSAGMFGASQASGEDCRL